MMCQRIGRPPISTMGLGRNSVSSRRRVPNPLQRTTTFITGSLQRFGAGKAWLPPSAEWIGSDMHRCLSALGGPPKRVVQLPGSLQALDLANPHVAAAFHVFSCEPHSTICIVEFLRPLAGGPRGTEVRQRAANLVGGHAITALVRTAALQWEIRPPPQAGGEMFSLHR